MGPFSFIKIQLLSAIGVRVSKKKKGNKEKKLKATSPVLNDLPTERIRALGDHLSNISSYADVGNAFMAMDLLKKEVDPILKSKGLGGSTFVDKTFNMFGVNDPFGYSPQGSTLKNIFPNPFGIFAYLADNYAPVRMCRNEYKKELKSDGFYLVGNEAKFASTLKTLKSLDMEKLFLRMCDHLLMYGNFWIWPIKNLLGGIAEFKLLDPQFLRPIMSNHRREIIGWEYEIGIGYIIFGLDDLIHGVQDPSMASPQLGSPRLGSLLVDIEADMQASMFNNTVFQKGGLIGIAILMDVSKNPNNVPGSGGPNNLANVMEAKLNSNKAGARAGYGYGVFEGVHKIEKLHDLAAMDGAFRNTKGDAKRDVAIVMGVPPSRVGVMLNTAGVYSPIGLEDMSALQWDKSVNELIAEVHETANDILLPMVKILDVQVKHHKRNHSGTRAATQAVLDLSQIDGVVSVDEARTIWLKRPPIGGTQGSAPLRRIPNVSVTSETLPAEEPIRLPAEEQQQIIRSEDDY